MAQTKKDSNKKSSTVEKEQSVKKASTGSKSTRSKTAEISKVVEGAKKSLTPKNGGAVKKSSTTKSDAVKKPVEEKKEEKIKGLTSYQEQALQGVTKLKSNKKLLIILLLLIGSVVVVGVAIALFFVLKPEEDTKAVVCEVRVLSYRVDKSNEEEEYIVLGSGDKFNFTKETQTTSSFTKDIETSIDEITDFSMTYLVNNISENSYNYTLDFSKFEILNCDVVVKINNGSSYKINSTTKSVQITEFGDVLFEIRISGINPPVYDGTNVDELISWAENTWCNGSIDLTLEVN